jgi:prepilin-type N-terminal cleavage/methylation domain-containing protein
MNSRGFSLIEIAVVLVIISVLIGIVAIPLATQVEQQRITDTNKQLEAIKEAIIGYALANGRFPCASRSSDNGVESVISASAGTCNAYVGYVPAVTLGLSPVDSSGFAVDGWGLTQNRILYAVANLSITAGTPTTCTSSVSNVLTKTDGMKTATMTCLADTSTSVNMLTVCAVTPTGAAGAATGCTSALTTKAPFILLSLGKNAPTGGTGTDEAHNIDTDSYFVSHTRTDSSSASGEFDDLVAWPSLNTIFARMVQAGKLP